MPSAISVGAKMIANKFKNRNLAKPRRSCRIHPRGLGFFCFSKGGVRDVNFFLSYFGFGGLWVFFLLFWIMGGFFVS